MDSVLRPVITIVNYQGHLFCRSQMILIQGFMKAEFEKVMVWVVSDIADDVNPA